MKFLLFFITYVFFISACNTNPNKVSINDNQAIGNDPNKPSFAGKPSDFSGSWSGTGTVDDGHKKKGYTCLVTTKQNLDTNPPNLPKDLEFTLDINDKIGDSVFSMQVTNLTIKMRSVEKADKTTVDIYEIFKGTERIGEIGENEFSLSYTSAGKILGMHVTNKKEMIIRMDKIVDKKKTIYRCGLKKT